VLPWALLGSAVLHLLFLVLSPLFLRLGPPPGDSLGEQAMARPEMRALELSRVEPASPEAASAAARAPTPPAERSIVPIPGPPSAAAPAGEARSASPGEAAAPGLRIGPRDPRLWVAPREFPAPPEPTEHERYMSHLRARLDAANDSMGIGPNLDWTTTDAEGRRWGLSPAGIHLGGVTVPRELLPLPRPSAEQEYADGERRRQREEILRDEDARERERVRNERDRRPRRSGDGG
jgi:hypothetical protein